MGPDDADHGQVPAGRAGARRRDRGEKKGIYGKAGVLEYWIVDARARTVTVFTGDGERFDAGRILSEREELQSRVLPALQLLVASLF